jgi:hypothetical protein
MFQQSPSRHLGTVDAIGNAHTLIGIPGEHQARVVGHASGNMGHTIQVSDVVLGHCLQVAGEAHNARLASQAKQLPQVVDDGLLDRRIGVCQLPLLQSATDKGTQQHLFLRRSAGKFDAAKRAGQQRPLFNGGYDETHPV